jgi:transcriptional regulator of aromatic amino acid metabolism
MSDELQEGVRTGSPESALIAAVSAARIQLAIVCANPESSPMLFANDAFAKMLGREEGELVGQAFAEAARETAPAEFGDSRARDDEVRRVEIMRQDGSTSNSAIAVAAVEGGEGEVACWLCSLIDAGESDVQPEVSVAREADALHEVARAASSLMSNTVEEARALAGFDRDELAVARGGHFPAATLKLKPSGERV